MNATLIPCVLASGLTRELTSSGPVLMVLIVAAVACLVVLTLAAPRLVQAVLLGALFIMPFTSVVPFLHPTSQNYYGYYALALAAFTTVAVLRQSRLPRTDLGAVFFAYLIVNWIVFAALTPTARNYYPLVIPLTELAVYVLILNRPSKETRPILLGGIVALGVAEALIGLCQSLFGPACLLAGTPGALQGGSRVFRLPHTGCLKGCHTGQWYV